MIFAAGLGTRLGGLTHHQPKALVPVAGVPMLERVARRLIAAGADRLIINTHHFAQQIVDFVSGKGSFGVEVIFSREPERPLETGGGLRRAAPLLDAESPFFLHNSDILTDLPLERLYLQHSERTPLATLAVMRRATSRYLLFDDDGLLGRVDEGKNVRIEARPARGSVQSLAFGGIHVVSPALLPLLPDEEVFSILDAYLDAVREGFKLEPFRCDGYGWVDIGKPEELDRAAEWVESGEGSIPG